MRIRIQGFNLLDSKKLEVWHQELCVAVKQNLPEYSRLENLNIEVSLKNMGEDAGLAKLDAKIIHLSPLVLPSNRWFKEAYAHELGHMLSSHFHQKNTEHGPLWKKVMKAMNMPAYTYHSFSETKTFVCNCLTKNTHQLSGAQLKSVEAGARFNCRRCHANIRPASY